MRLRKILKNKHGSLSLSVGFTYLFFILLIVFAISIPISLAMIVGLFEGSEMILQQTLDTADNIQDASIKQAIQNNVQNAKDATADNVEILSFLAQYAWLFIGIIITFIFYIIARERVETNIT